MATIIIPTPLRKFADNSSKIAAAGGTVLDVMQAVALQYPALKKQLFDDEGDLRGFLRIYKGDTDIRSLDGTATVVTDESIVSIVPAIAGGKS